MASVALTDVVSGTLRQAAAQRLLLDAVAASAPLARAAALEALSLEETDGEAHVVLGIESRWYEWGLARRGA